MLKVLKSILGKPVKEVSTNSFFQSIETAKAGNNVNVEIGEQKYLEILNKGISYLKEFSITNNGNDLDLLQKAAECFTETLEIKKNRPEPYFYLAHIFLLINEIEQALKYIKIVTFINSSFPGLQELKESINKIYTKNPTQTSTTVETVKRPAPGTVTSISYKDLRAQIKPKNKSLKPATI